MATGVLVVGINGGTKKLSGLLGGSKEYEATAILGASTDTYDRMGKVSQTAPWQHITREMVEEMLGQFRGNIKQVPPIYSALNMDGKRLYEYARSGEPLPAKIQARVMQVDHLELLEMTTDHDWTYPMESTPSEVAAVVQSYNVASQLSTGIKAPPAASAGPDADGDVEPEKKRIKLSKGKSPVSPPPPSTDTTDTTSTEPRPPILKFRMKVSSGFYVRSFIHDLGIALGSAAHMIALVRTRQSDWALGQLNTFEWTDFGLSHPIDYTIPSNAHLKPPAKNVKSAPENKVEGEGSGEKKEAGLPDEGPEEEKPRPLWESRLVQVLEDFVREDSSKESQQKPKQEPEQTQEPEQEEEQL